MLLDPSAKDAVQVIALTDQIVEADGKTYRSSINHAITTETFGAGGARDPRHRGSRVGA